MSLQARRQQTGQRPYPTFVAFDGWHMTDHSRKRRRPPEEPNRRHRRNICSWRTSGSEATARLLYTQIKSARTLYGNEFCCGYLSQYCCRIGELRRRPTSSYKPSAARCRACFVRQQFLGICSTLRASTWNQLLRLRCLDLLSNNPGRDGGIDTCSTCVSFVVTDVS